MPNRRHIAAYWTARRAFPRSNWHLVRANTQYLLDTGRDLPAPLTEDAVQRAADQARFDDGDLTLDSKLGLSPTASQA